jgi:hypothetical protein
MPEILFITNEQSLLEIIDQLKALVDVRIDIVNDFSQGLKEIFFRQPAVVFIQSEIGGITGEKVASQVRALLEDEPIKLVLLHNKANEWQVADSNFNGNIDISLPPQELIRQLQEQVYDALYAVQGMPADAGETQQNDKEKGELPIDSPKPVDEYAIDSLADIFPAHLPEDWGAPLHDDEKDAQTVARTVEPVVEPIKPGEEFSFDTIQDNFSDVAEGSTVPPLLPETGLLQEPLVINSLPGQDPAGDNERPEGDVRPEGQEPPPYLSSSISGEILSGMDFHQFETFGSAIAEEGRGSPEPVLTFVDPPETSGANSSSLAAPAGHPERSTAMADQASPLLSAAQTEVPSLLGGSTPPRAGSWPEHFGTDAPDAEFANDIPFREDFGKKSPLTLKVFIGLLILIISLAVLYIVRDWSGVSEQVPTVTAPPPTPVTAPVRDLPAFIPRVAPDSAYAAAHPGWERREADGLEYLIYRENGRIRAIQVIAGPRGVISAPFLKTCIKETTGREDADNWIREKRDDFLVEKGTLRNKGELAVYRKIPEGDIRGFVLTFY